MFFSLKSILFLFHGYNVFLLHPLKIFMTALSALFLQRSPPPSLLPFFSFSPFLSPSLEALLNVQPSPLLNHKTRNSQLEVLCVPGQRQAGGEGLRQLTQQNLLSLRNEPHGTENINLLLRTCVDIDLACHLVQAVPEPQKSVWCVTSAGHQGWQRVC